MNRRVSTALNQTCGQDRIGSPFRVEDDLATLFGCGLIGTSVEESVAVGVVVALLAAATEVEAAELLFLGFLVVVGKVVGLRCADVDAGRAGSASGHDHGATTIGVSLALLRNLHLVTAGNQLRGCVLPCGSGS